MMKPERDPKDRQPAKPTEKPAFIEGELTDDELRQVTGGGTRWSKPPVNGTTQRS